MGFKVANITLISIFNSFYSKYLDVKEGKYRGSKKREEKGRVVVIMKKRNQILHSRAKGPTYTGLPEDEPRIPSA